VARLAFGVGFLVAGSFAATDFFVAGVFFAFCAGFLVAGSFAAADFFVAWVFLGTVFLVTALFFMTGLFLVAGFTLGKGFFVGAHVFLATIFQTGDFPGSAAFIKSTRDLR
jgi:hypothetical protein